MGALMLFVVIALVAVNLAFTVKIWKDGVLKMRTSKKVVDIPRGVDYSSYEKESASKSDIDLKALIGQVTEQMKENAEECGEDEIEVNDEDIQAATRAVLASLGR